MDTKKINRIVAGIVFLISFIQLTMTCQPSVPFWDCGEYATASVSLQVNHPPGVPLFEMTSRFFQMLPFGDPGWRTNMLSVLTGALAVMLCYLIGVNVIRMWRKKIETKTDMLLIFGAALVGALAFSFSDSFWFNSVETEIYTPGALLVALQIWLATQWWFRADEPGSERYLLLIAYLIGLATGVYMFATLPLFMIVMIIYFRKYDVNVKSFLIMCGAAVVIFLSIYPGIVIYLPMMMGGNIPYFKTTDASGLRIPAIQDSPIMPILAILILAGIAYFFLWSRKQKKNPLWGIIAISFLCFVTGYMSFTMILLRSNAHPPLNEDQPDNFVKLASYLSREQYGEAPLITPRRWSHEPRNENTWRNYKSDGQFFWNYQIDHMFLRYWEWQYIGRAGDIQDAPVGFKFGLFPDAKKDLKQWWYGSSYDGTFPIRFFGIPFFLGLFGMYWHFKKDWKMGLVYLAGFLSMGVVAAFVQNQQDAQPRERDYFYVGAFFVYSMWIGFGTLGILELIEEKIGNRVQGWFGPAVATLAVIAIAVDFNMGYNGWKLHDRSLNYLPWDYSYNILQSCEKNAILFTEGDNDTFPLWYLQDVVGVRRDIRIVNLSLGQTHWYVSQLKNERPYGTDVVPISIPQEALDKSEDDNTGFYPQPGDAKPVVIPVPRDTMAHYTNDSMALAHPELRFNYTPSQTYPIGGKRVKFFGTADQLVYDIVKTNAAQGWKRPIYWSVTCSPADYVGMNNYLRTDGLALRLVPAASHSYGGTEPLNTDAMYQNLMDEPDHGYTDAHYGFRFRELNNPHMYMDEVHRRLLGTYRQGFLTLAMNYIYQQKPDYAKADSVLNMMNKKIPHEVFPMQYELLYQTSILYQTVGDTANFMKLSGYGIAACKELADNTNLRQFIDQRYLPYELMLDLYEKRGDYSSGIDLLNSILPQAQGDAKQQSIIQQKIYQFQIKDLEKQGKYTDALNIAQKGLASIGNGTGQNSMMGRQIFGQAIAELRIKAGLPPQQDTATPAAKPSGLQITQ